MKKTFYLMLVTANLAYASAIKPRVTRDIIENNVDEGTRFRTSTEAAEYTIEFWEYSAYSIPDKKPLPNPKAVYIRLKEQYDKQKSEDL